MLLVGGSCGSSTRFCLLAILQVAQFPRGGAAVSASLHSQLRDCDCDWPVTAFFLAHSSVEKKKRNGWSGMSNSQPVTPRQIILVNHCSAGFSRLGSNADVSVITAASGLQTSAQGEQPSGGPKPGSSTAKSGCTFWASFFFDKRIEISSQLKFQGIFKTWS